MTFAGDSTKQITGPHDIIINGVQLGHTEEDIQLLQFGAAETRHLSHEAGEVPTKITRGPRTIRLEARSVQVQANVLFEVFAEAASVTSAGLVTVGAASGAQDSYTALTGVTITLHPTDAGDATNDIVLNNMVSVGGPIDQAVGRQNKIMINMFYERTWSDSSVAYTIGGKTNPA